MNVVFATRTVSVKNPTGPGTVTVVKGEAWNADHPFVKARKDLFTDSPDPEDVRGGLVERATAAPGEKRRRK